MQSTSKKDGQRAQIFGVPISGSSRGQVLKMVEGWIDGKESREAKNDGVSEQIRLIFTPNTEILTLATHDRGFCDVLRQADINIPDGVGLVAAYRILKWFGKWESDQTISTSLPGVDVAHDIVMEAIEKGWKVFILGGRPGIAEKAAQMLESEARNAGKIVDSRFAWMVGRPEDADVLNKINEFKPDVLLVALGQGKQERWLVNHRGEVRAKVGMVIGGAIDFWSGKVSRAPLWVRRWGLEWLYRLIQEPWRWRRQLSLIEFGWLVFGQAFGIWASEDRV
jgi:N-acetylglucosaminyldiphosphoundecaprenol N-acetyl-beta-D-mannosaminyltransferase